MTTEWCGRWLSEASRHCRRLRRKMVRAESTWASTGGLTRQRASHKGARLAIGCSSTRSRQCMTSERLRKHTLARLQPILIEAILQFALHRTLDYSLAVLKDRNSSPNQTRRTNGEVAMSKGSLFNNFATWVTAFAVWAGLSIGGIARAEVKPGDLINSDNASKVKDLVGPGVYYKVEHGMQMKIVPTSRIDWPPPYKDATEKYSGQVHLSDDHRSVVGYVAGQPFPLIDANDRDAATKIMWNNVFRPIISDDYDLRF